MNSINNYYEDEISLVDILKFFIRHFKIITICTLLFFIIGIIFLVFLPTKGSYTAEAALIVLGTRSEINIESKSNLLGVKELADIYPPRLQDRRASVIGLVKSPLIVSLVIEKLKGLNKKIGNFNIESFVSSKSELLKVEQAGEVVKVKVKLPDKELAKFFADEIVKTTVEFVRKELYFDLSQQEQEKLVKVAYLSILPEKPEDIKKNKVLVLVLTFFGFLLGIIIGSIKDVYPKIKIEA